MGLFKKFIKGNYKASVKCPNCGFGSEVKVPIGISVPDFIKGVKCKCDNCLVVFFPEEYTTEHFENEKRGNMDIKRIKNAVATPLKPLNKPKRDVGDIKLW